MKRKTLRNERYTSVTDITNFVTRLDFFVLKFTRDLYVKPSVRLKLTNLY